MFGAKLKTNHVLFVTNMAKRSQKKSTGHVFTGNYSTARTKTGKKTWLTGSLPDRKCSTSLKPPSFTLCYHPPARCPTGSFSFLCGQIHFVSVQGSTVRKDACCQARHTARHTAWQAPGGQKRRTLAHLKRIQRCLVKRSRSSCTSCAAVRSWRHSSMSFCSKCFLACSGVKATKPGMSWPSLL